MALTEGQFKELTNALNQTLGKKTTQSIYSAAGNLPNKWDLAEQLYGAVYGSSGASSDVSDTPPVDTFESDVDAFASSRVKNREPDFDIGQISGSELLDQAEDTVSEMMSGKIPEDVIDEIERINAERGILGGFGMGEFTKNLAARDLGLTSLDLINQGVAQAPAIAGQKLTYAQHLEQIREWEDSYAMALKQHGLDSTRVALEGSELIAKNQRFALELSTDILLANAKREVPSAQEHINTVMGIGGEAGYLNPTNRAVLDIIESL
jgi:hypothetical protein